MQHTSAGFVDAADIVQFDRLGDAWWDERGPMAALHRLNPVRIRYVRDQALAHFGAAVGGDTDRGSLPLAGLRILDVGCGGGLLSEPLARLGGRVTGIDPAARNIGTAAEHAGATGVAVDYRAVTIEDVAAGGERFDLVIASEVVEHVLDQPAFVATACRLVRPGGMLLVSTLNRTLKCFALAIVGAEYVLGWLPRGTHKWQRFVRPNELGRWARDAGLHEVDATGMVFDPLRDRWRLGHDTDVNYWFAAARPAGRGG